MRLHHCAAKALCAAPFILLLTACGGGKATINVNDYFTTEITGYEGGGNVSATVDAGTLVADNLEAFGLKDTDSVLAFSKIVADVESNLVGSFDNCESLSNGDKATYTWDKLGIDTLESNYNLNLEIDNITVDIVDLPEIQDFNPFDYITIEYEDYYLGGYAPKAIIDDSCPVPDLGVGFAGINGFYAGETISATIGAPGSPVDWYEEGHTQEEWVKEYCLKYGMNCTEMEREFTIPRQ